MDDATNKTQGTLASLANSSGVDARIIVEANGVQWSTKEINAWVIASGGRWLPHVDGTAMVPGSPTGGWAVFQIGNKVWQPCSLTVDADKMDWAKWITAGAVVVGTGVAIFGRKKGRR